MLIVNQTSFTSDPVPVSVNGLLDLHISITGPGPVAIEQKDEGGTYRSYPETTFTGPAAKVLTIGRGDWRVVISGGPTTVQVQW